MAASSLATFGLQKKKKKRREPWSLWRWKKQWKWPLSSASLVKNINELNLVLDKLWKSRLRSWASVKMRPWGQWRQLPSARQFLSFDLVHFAQVQVLFSLLKMYKVLQGSMLLRLFLYLPILSQIVYIYLCITFQLSNASVKPTSDCALLVELTIAVAILNSFCKNWLWRKKRWCYHRTQTQKSIVILPLEKNILYT